MDKGGQQASLEIIAGISSGASSSDDNGGSILGTFSNKLLLS